MYNFSLSSRLWDRPPNAPKATPIQPKTTYSIFLSFITSLQSLFLFFHFQYMAHSRYRVAEYHPRPRKTHDCTDFLPHFRLIAVYLTIRAKCLFLHKRASVAPLPCVCIEGCTFRADAIFPPMLPPAVKCALVNKNWTLKLYFLTYNL